MEVLNILDAPEPIFNEACEPFAYIEHELTCPFCDENMIGLVIENGSEYYRCGTCENDWSVLGAIH